MGRRIVLNDGLPSGGTLGGEVAEDLLLRWRRALVSGPAAPDASQVQAAAGRAADLNRVDLGRLGTREARLAFWINVYNALAIHGIVALGIRHSVLRVWNFFGRVSYRVGGALWSLDEIEHGLLRGNRRRVFPPWPVLRRDDCRRRWAIEPPDPRIHFALNCGARSCPPVGVYHAGNLDRELEWATRHFINDEVQVDARGRIQCSKLFRWYARDFGSPAELRDLLVRHLDDGPGKAALLAGAPLCTRLRPYSWAVGYRWSG